MACLIAPTDYRLNFTMQESARCGSVILPAAWTFDDGDDEGGEYQLPQIAFEARRPAASNSFLIAGRIQSGSSHRYSREVYRISFDGGPKAIPATAGSWDAAARGSQLLRKPVSSPRSGNHAQIEPRIDFDGRRFPLTGKMFWDCAEATRLSESERFLLGISYSHTQGALRPKSMAHFDLFSTRSGRLLWSASGEGPTLPPFSQFDAVAWIGDDILFMPHNGIGTRFDVCFFLPEMLGR